MRLEEVFPFNSISVQEMDWLPVGKMIKAGRAVYVPCIYPFIFLEGVTEDSVNRAIDFAKKKVLKTLK